MEVFLSWCEFWQMSFDSMIVSSGIWFHNVLECLSFFWVKVCNFFRLLISCHNNTVKCTFCYHDDNHLRGLWKFSENSFRCYSLENVMRNLLFWCTEIWLWSFIFSWILILVMVKILSSLIDFWKMWFVAMISRTGIWFQLFVKMWA